MSEPNTSVVMPAFNAEATIAASIDSILEQTRQDFEVIVVDDGSTDRTAEIVAGFGDSVRLLRQENRGPSAARNLGVAEARGEWIAFLDSDDRWHRDMLRSRMAALERDGAAGLAYTNCWNTDGDSLLPLNRGAQRTAYSGWVFTRLISENFLTTSTVLVRRALLQQVGGFDEEMRISEDYDLWLRLARITRFVFVDRPLAFYLHPSTTFGDLDERLDARLRILGKLQGNPAPELLGHGGMQEFCFRYEYHLGHRYLRVGRRSQARRLFRQAAGRGIESVRIRFALALTWIPAPVFSVLQGARAALVQRRECLETLRFGGTLDGGAR